MHHQWIIYSYFRLNFFYNIVSSLDERKEERNHQQILKSLEEDIDKLKEEKMNLETDLKTSKVEILSLKDRLEELIRQMKEDKLVQEAKYSKVFMSF